jgi:hypothetical protein
MSVAEVSAEMPRARSVIFARAARAVEGFFLAPMRHEPIALVRILYGFTLFWSYALLTPELERIFGPDSVSVHVFPSHADMFVPHHLWLAHTLLLAGCACFTAGFLTPLAGIAIIVMHIAFRDVSYLHTWGWTRLVHPVVGYLVLANSGASYSVDAWLKRRFWPSAGPSRNHTWAIRLLQFHITALYMMVAWHRIYNELWLSGSMVYVALANTVFTRFPNLDLQMLKPLLWLCCWIAWLFELGAPLFLWIPRTRTLFVLGLMAMHLGLELTSTVGWWQVAMLSLLWIFLPPDWSKAVLERGLRLRAPATA